MNPAAGEERLPRTIPGLLGFAFRTLAERAPLYLLLSLAVFVAEAAAEWALPAATEASRLGMFKLYVLTFTSVFADAFVIAAVALGAGTRAGGAIASSRALAGGAVERWLPVIAIGLLVQFTMQSTVLVSGLVPPADAKSAVLVAVMAPVTWLLWGVLGIAAPVAALSGERSGRAIVMSFGRAFAIALRVHNLSRLAVLAVAAVLPWALEIIAVSQLQQHHVARALFWGNAPFDALTVAPLAALQTAFALDFARRAGRLADPPR